jgi:hypothetical protein
VATLSTRRRVAAQQRAPAPKLLKRASAGIRQQIQQLQPLSAPRPESGKRWAATKARLGDGGDPVRLGAQVLGDARHFRDDARRALVAA